jgi:hypothetical protein
MTQQVNSGFCPSTFQTDPSPANPITPPPLSRKWCGTFLAPRFSHS